MQFVKTASPAAAKAANFYKPGFAKQNTRLIWPGALRVLVGFGDVFAGFCYTKVLDGTTACEKRLLQIIFCFEHFFYSSAIFIL